MAAADIFILYAATLLSTYVTYHAAFAACCHAGDADFSLMLPFRCQREGSACC